MRTKTKESQILFVWLVWFVIKILFFSSVLNAQSSGVFVVPRQIFVGDPAVLVLTLPAAAQNRPDIVLLDTSLPSDINIDFHRITLEQRTLGSRLLVEFTAFVPGDLEFPPIEIGGEYFEGLTVTVNTILDGRSDRTLSGTAATLAIPGTAMMLYGSMAALAVILLLAIWFAVKGRKVLRFMREKWKIMRLFAGLRKIERRLSKETLNGADYRIILDKLSDETRDFLSILTGENCRAMTASEFEKLPKESLLIQEGNSSFLSIFFHRCDQLRFSGANVTSHNILHLLGFLRNFIDVLVKAKKKENFREGKAA